MSRIFHANNSRSFTIDLSQKKLPVVQCMVRNTLRDILQLTASTCLVLMNTGSRNIERIKRIVHSSDFDHERRKEALIRIYGE